MLSKKELEKKIAEYEDIENQIKELEAMRDAVKSAVTKEMDRRGIEELGVGNKIVRWTTYVTNRFDSTGFKKARPDEYAAWQKQVTGRRFTVSG